MVGLSIVLESHKATKTTTSNDKYHPQVINKATTIMIKTSPPASPSPPSLPPPPLHRELQRNPPPSSLPAASFLDRCFLCCQKLLLGKDIYMYKGDRAFCSVECRCRQIFMDEEQTINPLRKKDNCSVAAMKPTASSSPSSTSSSSSRNRKGPRNGGANGFAY